MVLRSKKQEVILKLFAFSSIKNHDAYKFSCCVGLRHDVFTAPQDIQMYGQGENFWVGGDQSPLHSPETVTVRVSGLIFCCPLQCVQKEPFTISHPLLSVFSSMYLSLTPTLSCVLSACHILLSSLCQLCTESLCLPPRKFLW